MIKYDKWKLQTPVSFEDETEVIEIKNEINLESILNKLVLARQPEKMHIIQAIIMILEFSNEPGVDIYDVRQLLNDLYENL